MYFAAVAISIFAGVLWVVLRYLGRRRKEYAVGFFHPYTNDGGGGERVLWCAVRAIQAENPDLSCVIYTGDEATSESLAARARRQFGVELSSLPKVVRLQKRRWVEPKSYPYFTLLGQSLGSMVLGMEALLKSTPLVFFDTSGYAFTYPLARALGCQVVSYTHYPTISSDMLARVLRRTSAYNNNLVIARSHLLSLLKALYYLLMMLSYGLAGRCVHLAMVNSSWTQDHIQRLWRVPNRIKRVYPPCDTRTLQTIPLRRKGESTYFISVAQFRPEKAHGVQLEAFARLLEGLHAADFSTQSRSSSVRLKLVGSCRNKEDEERVEKLKLRCSELGIAEQVDFLVNVTYRELVDLLGGAIAGLHSMIDEHFGIVVVEYMAAGAIPIAHNSAGPKMDIVAEQEGCRVGFLAASVAEFASAMAKVLCMPEEELLEMAALARQRAMSFSEARFDEDLKAAISPILSHTKHKGLNQG
ncbi:hypothetical protein GOP47_0016757 [Adiantum capillus-veneris]|uniref:GDP-Man:Man(3)GlcNAc(2)-PP-Dol alpha-1,2-mannosyltransferase n=1 Tax=Adiantum capillus-veneris TaxID=13818 RepID=A0A9D4UIY5_ADICA|nr:hypothetical protein GOP47_0016757 [Adiantum capillus-veneris]